MVRQMVNKQGPPRATAELRLAELGIELTPAPIPFGAYVESVQTGNLLYLTGVLAAIGHELNCIGLISNSTCRRNLIHRGEFLQYEA